MLIKFPFYIGLVQNVLLTAKLLLYFFIHVEMKKVLYTC